MENTSYIALSGQMALWRNLDSVANNIANLNTQGYQSEQMVFSDYLIGSRNSQSRLKQNMAYVQDIGAYRDLSVGAITETGNPLDLAIEGEGYFEFDDAAGPLYSRCGRFTLNADGMIISMTGHPVMSDAGRPLIVAPNEKDLTITADGSVSTENGVIGRIRVVTFDDQLKMRRVGSNYLEAGDQDPRDVTDAHVRQGMIEGSNVNAVVEMTAMIQIQRAYEMANSVIEREDERMKRAYEVLSGVRTA